MVLVFFYLDTLCFLFEWRKLPSIMNCFQKDYNTCDLFNIKSLSVDSDSMLKRHPLFPCRSSRISKLPFAFFYQGPQTENPFFPTCLFFVWIWIEWLSTQFWYQSTWTFDQEELNENKPSNLGKWTLITQVYLSDQTSLQDPILISQVQIITHNHPQWISPSKSRQLVQITLASA